MMIISKLWFINKLRGCLMMVVSDLGDETEFLVRNVVDFAYFTVRLEETVRSFYFVAVSDFVLVLDVVRVGIVYAVFVVVFRMRLEKSEDDTCRFGENSFLHIHTASRMNIDARPTKKVVRVD